MKNKKTYFSAITCALCTVLLLACFVLMPYLSLKTDNTVSLPIKTSLRVQVTSMNGTPLQNAQVTVLEQGKTFLTDNNGFSPAMEVPVIKNTLADSNFGTVTVVVKCVGYVDYILYGCVVHPERMRNGPVIILFSNQQSDAKFVVVSEVPPSEFTQQLIDSCTVEK